MQKSIPSNQFQNVSFALFCLGDRAYGPTAFCAAGRKLATRLSQLGATVYCNIGYGDDGTPNGGVFHDLDTWIENELIPCMFLGKCGDDKSTTATAGAAAAKGTKRIPQQIFNEIIGRRHQTIESPFQIIFSSSSLSSLDNNRQDSIKEEWQMQQYSTAYNEFFESLRPKHSYQYDVNTGYRLLNRDTDNRGESAEEFDSKTVDDDDNCQNWPLVGQITTNRRLTSKEWKQDTRHLQIHVCTNHYKKFTSKHTEKNEYQSPRTLSPSTTTTTTMGIPLPYKAGDIATIIPSNSKSIVKKFISCLPSYIQSKIDIPICIATTIMPSTQYKTNYTAWPSYATLRGILTFCADISSLPEREDLRSLSRYCNFDHPMGMDQQQKLISLSETSDAALYGDYIIREKRNWADVLFDFDSIQYEDSKEKSNLGGAQNGADDDGDDSNFIPLDIEHLLMILSPIMPRHFSIASAPSAQIANGTDEHPSLPTTTTVTKGGYVHTMGTCGFDVELCVAVVKGSTPHGRNYVGLCSNYMAQRRAVMRTNSSKQSIVRLWIRPGSFDKLPLDVITTNYGNNYDGENPRSFKTPIVCIGSGTGVAPLRSLISERESILKTMTIECNVLQNEPVGFNTINKDNILIFGCRKESEDYYYEKEWKSFGIRGSFTILTAFSQDQKHKVYVQHIVRDTDEGSFIARHILEHGGAVYVAGGAKMARAVKEEILECLSRYLPNGLNDAKKLLQKLQRIGKFSVEAWS